MAYDIDWTDTANTDLGAIVRFIANDNIDAARDFGNLIIYKVESIVDFPESGRIVPEENDEALREVIVSPYRIVYEIDSEKEVIYVVRVWHSARGSIELF